MCEEWDLADAYTLVDYMRGLGLRTIVLPSARVLAHIYTVRHTHIVVQIFYLIKILISSFLEERKVVSIAQSVCDRALHFG